MPRRKPNAIQRHPLSRSTLTDLGLLFGMSALQMGKKLKALGFRHQDGSPSQAALSAGLAQQEIQEVRIAGGRSIKKGAVTWHRQNTYEALVSAGLKALGAPGDEMFALGARAHTMLTRAEREHDRDEMRANWTVEMATNLITRRLGTMRPRGQQAHAERLFTLLTGTFGHEQRIVEILLSGLDVPIESVRRGILSRKAIQSRQDVSPEENTGRRRI